MLVAVALARGCKVCKGSNDVEFATLYSNTGYSYTRHATPGRSNWQTPGQPLSKRRTTRLSTMDLIGRMLSVRSGPARSTPDCRSTQSNGKWEWEHRFMTVLVVRDPGLVITSTHSTARTTVHSRQLPDIAKHSVTKYHRTLSVRDIITVFHHSLSYWALTPLNHFLLPNCQREI